MHNIYIAVQHAHIGTILGTYFEKFVAVHKMALSLEGRRAVSCSRTCYLLYRLIRYNTSIHSITYDRCFRDLFEYTFHDLIIHDTQTD